MLNVAHQDIILVILPVQIRQLSKAIKLKPDNSQAYYIRGMAKIVIEQKEAACIDLKKALELGFSSAANAIKEYCN